MNDRRTKYRKIGQKTKAIKNLESESEEEQLIYAGKKKLKT